MKLHYVLALLITPAIFAQTTQKQPTYITVKGSPAEDALVKASKEGTEKQNEYNIMLQQARTTLQENQKDIAKKLTEAQNDLNEKLKVDKKYKPMVDNIIMLQNQMADASKTVQNGFDQKSRPLLEEIDTDKALVKGLIPVVRKENNLPDNATFDPETQKWSVAK